jgi:hypothetical protein
MPCRLPKVRHAVSQETAPKTYHGVFYGVLLGTIFITLKLTGVVAWSWWLVTAPLWVPTANILTQIALGVVLGVAKGFFKLLSAK